MTSPVRQGTYAARFEVRSGDDPINSSGERCELRKSTGEAERVEAWWAWSTYFPDEFDPNPGTNWNIYTQWHGTGSSGQPNVSFDVATTTDPWTLTLRVRGGSATAPTLKRFSFGSVERNRWYDFVFHVYWSSSGDGYVEVWKDGAKVIERTQTPTLYAGQGVYLKQGFYRGESPLTTVLLHDDTRRGESCADVGCAEAPPNSAPVAPTNDSPPTVVGVTQERERLTAAEGVWSGTAAAYSYEWRRCDAEGASCAMIAGATARTYTLAAADVDATIRVAVTATNPAGSTTAVSAATGLIRLAPPLNTVLPRISGTARVGRTLTTDDGVWTSSRPVTYAYQWRRCDRNGLVCTDIAGATAKAYTVVAADRNSTIRAVVTASNLGGSTAAVSSKTTVVKR